MENKRIFYCSHQTTTESNELTYVLPLLYTAPASLDQTFGGEVVLSHSARNHV